PADAPASTYSLAPGLSRASLFIGLDHFAAPCAGPFRGVGRLSELCGRIDPKGGFFYDPVASLGAGRHGPPRAEVVVRAGRGPRLRARSGIRRVCDSARL